MNLDRWLRQPTTIHALGVIAAGAGAALAHVATGDPKIDVAIGVAAYVLLHLGIDDHSAGEQDVTALVTDLARPNVGVAKITDDALSAVRELQPAAPAASRVAGGILATLALLALGCLSACAPGTAGGNLEAGALSAAKVDSATAQTIVVDANFGATLACAYKGQIAAVTNVKVNGATAAAVASACQAIAADGVPVPAPAGATLPVVTAPQAAAAAVAASQAASAGARP